MEDFYNSPLIQSIKDKIKTNNNKGITGNILQEELLKIVSALDLGGMFLGFASKSTNPGNEGKSRANGFYFSTEEGTYTNFIGSNNQPLVIGSDLEIIYREVINDTLTWNHRSIASQFSISGEEGNFVSFDANGNLEDSGKNAGSFSAVLVVNNIEQLTSEQIEGLKVGDVVSAREFGTLTQEMVNFTVQSKSVESCRLESVSSAQVLEVSYTKENNLWVFEYSRVMAFEDLADIDLGNLSGDGEARFDAKADKVSDATSGNFAGLDANGNITDSNYRAADFVQNITRGGSTLTKTNGVVDIPEEIENVVATPVAAGGNPTVNLTNGTLTFGLPSGADAYNPFKGTYLITDTLPTTGQAGDYIYVVDSQTPPVTHLYAWDGTTFSDTLETVTIGDSQFANSTKPISQTSVVNDFITGGEYDVASAETVKTIAETTMNYVEGSANILDPSTIKVGYYIYHKANDLSDVKNGTEQPIPSTLLYVYGCTDYIPIPQNGLILNKSAKSQGTAPTALIFSDKNGTIVDRIVVTSENSPAIINPSGQTDWNYVRFNVGLLSEGESINDYCVYEGQTLPQGDPIPYVATRWEMKQQEIPAGAVTTPKLGNASVTTSKIANGAVTVDKADFVVEHTSKNLCNPQDADFELNHYIRYTDGANIDASSNYPNRYGATPFIPITEEGLVLNYPSDYGSLSGWAIYKADKTTFVRGEQESGEYVYDSTTDSDAAYIRFTFDFANKDEIQVEKGNTITSYTPYTPSYYEFDSTKVRLPEQSQVDIRLDNRKSVRDNVGSLAANTTHSIAAFPSYLKKNIICSFEGKFSSTFSTTSVGFGNDSNAVYLIITGEKVYLKRSIDISATPSGTINNTEITHNLTITDYLRVSMKVSITKVEFTIATRNGIFHHEYSLQSIYEFYGKPTIKSSIAFTDVVMSATSDDFTKNVWVVGDSLVSIYPQRWTHYLLREWGYDNWLLQGKAGGGSSTLWADLQLSLSLGMPKVLVWLLGTNDGDSDYESYVTTVCNYCDSHNITLILGKFPDPYGNTVTANRSWAVKNNYMLTTNKRYIDFRRAVTEEEGVTFDGITVGKWYGDDFTIPTDDSANWPSTAYINYDRVHPSIEGAKAEAAQVLIDCPELMHK